MNSREYGRILENTKNTGEFERIRKNLIERREFGRILKNQKQANRFLENLVEFEKTQKNLKIQEDPKESE